MIVRHLLRFIGAGFCLSSIFIAPLKWINPPCSSFTIQYAIQKKSLKEGFIRGWTPIKKIPASFIYALLAGEDNNFFFHCGINFSQIGYLLAKNRACKTLIGGSTLTQQLAKNLFLYKKKSYFRKAIEAYLALLLEAYLTKERILEIYINCIEYGLGMYGIHQGCMLYFSIDPSALRYDQSCLLLGALPTAFSIKNKEDLIRSPKVLYRASFLYKRGFLVAEKLDNTPSVLSDLCFPLL